MKRSLALLATSLVVFAASISGPVANAGGTNKDWAGGTNKDWAAGTNKDWAAGVVDATPLR